VSADDFQDLDIEQDAPDQTHLTQRSMWGMLGLGLAIGLIGMNLVIANPLIQRIDQMQRDIAALQRNFNTLAAAGEGLAETNSLLSGLSAQQRQIAEARKSLDQIRDLHNTLLSRRTQTEVARQGAERLIALQDQILDQRELTLPAQQALDRSADIRRQVIESLPQVESAATAVQSASELHGRIVRDLSDLAGMQSTVQGLIDLKSLVMNQGTDVEVARNKYQDILNLYSRIVEPGLDLDLATRSLGQLLELKNRLVKETDGVIGAVQTLEILGDFQEEFSQRVNSLRTMHQDLMQIVMMETTIGRVVKALEPILQLGDLRRLSESEVREAARTILDRRSARIADQSQAEEKPSHILAVPEEPSHREFPVPAPRDILLK